MVEPRILFLGGPQRSGTTLLQVLIQNSLRDCPFIPEVHYVADSMGAIIKQFSMPGKSRGVFGNGFSEPVVFRQTISALIQPIIEAHMGAKFLVLKDPNFRMAYREIVNSFGNQAILLTKRHPLDIVSSFLEIGAREYGKGNLNDKYATRKLDFIVKKVVVSMQQIISARNYGVTVVSYENLVANPQEVLSQITDFYGFVFSPPSELVWPRAESLHRETWRSPLLGKPISSNSIGNWKKVLSHEEQEFCWTFLKPFAIELGYQR